MSVFPERNIRACKLQALTNISPIFYQFPNFGYFFLSEKLFFENFSNRFRLLSFRAKIFR